MALLYSRRQAGSIRARSRQEGRGLLGGLRQCSCLACCQRHVLHVRPRDRLDRLVVDAGDSPTRDTAATGGSISLTSGAGTATSSGSIPLTTDSGGPSGVSGAILLSTGSSGRRLKVVTGQAPSGSAGSITLSVGSGDKTGGTVAISAGPSSGTSQTGGAVTSALALHQVVRREALRSRQGPRLAVLAVRSR
jgi:hypothetical protein